MCFLRSYRWFFWQDEPCYISHVNTIDFLIEKLESLQIAAQADGLEKGMFGSQRFHSFLPYLRKDNNIFFPASIAYVLQNLSPHLELRQREKVDQITEGIRNNYHLYASTGCDYVYNFYQTKPNMHYPYGWVLSRLKHFALAEDADDTVILWMTSNHLSAERAKRVKEKLVPFANLSQKKIKGMDSTYAELPFYGTWLGSGKMPIELEICVLCNILTFTFRQNLTLNQQDRASLEVIKRAIDSHDLMTNSFTISGMYPNTSVILYHIARLCAVMRQPGSYFDTEKLIQMMTSRLTTRSVLEKIILSISLMNLGQPCESVAWDFNDPVLKRDFRHFPFFIAPMLSGMSNNILFRLKKYRLFHILFRCDAFYLTLLLEYEVKKNLPTDR